MDIYLLTIYATLEQEEAIKELFHRMDWEFKKKVDDGGIRSRTAGTDIHAVPYKFISNNIPVGNVYIKRTNIAQLPCCECNPLMENPCSFESSCYNRLMWYECHPATCPSGKKCQNQNFQTKEYPPQEPFQTVNRGLGLRTLVDIKRGQFVNEYVGEIIDNELCRERITQAQQNKCTNFYLLALDKYRICGSNFRISQWKVKHVDKDWLKGMNHGHTSRNRQILPPRKMVLENESEHACLHWRDMFGLKYEGDDIIRDPLPIIRVIDARFKGNLSRFINHSCEPNLVTQKWHVNGDVRIGLYALKDIQAGTELTFNYNFDCLGNEKIPCKCRAANCSGYLGDHPKPVKISASKKQARVLFPPGKDTRMLENQMSYDDEEDGQEEAIDLSSSSSGRGQQINQTDPWEVPEILVNITKSALKTLSNLRSSHQKTSAQLVREGVLEKEVTQSAETQNQEKNDMSVIGSSQNADASADESSEKTYVHLTGSYEKTYVLRRTESPGDTAGVSEVESPETTGVLLTERPHVTSTPVPGSSKTSDSSLTAYSPLKPGKSPQQVSALESEILQWFVKLHTPTLESASQVGISEELSNLIESHRSQARNTPEALLEKFKTLATTTGNVLVQSHPFQPVVQFTALSADEDAHPYDAPESCIGAMETCGETQHEETDLYKGIASSYFTDDSSDSSHNNKSASLDEENQENIPQPLSTNVKVKLTKRKVIKAKTSKRINRKRKLSSPDKNSPPKRVARKSSDKSVSSQQNVVTLSKKQTAMGRESKSRKGSIKLAVRKVPKMSSGKLMASRKRKMESEKKRNSNNSNSGKFLKMNASKMFIQALLNENQNENKVTTTRYREGDYVCSLCGLRFKTEKRFQKHKQLDKCLYECPYCYKVYNVSNYTNYKAHLRVHENNKPFKCDQCEKAFNWEADLKNHKVIHTGLRPYVCKVCLKCFTNPHYMKTHVLNMHTGKPKAYLCDICGTGFKLKGNLSDHVRTVHATFRAFNCKQCGKAFKSKSHLTKHLTRHQPVTFPCDKCNKVFVEEKYLEKHKTRHKKAN